jgi:hypothetical protein
VREENKIRITIPLDKLGAVAVAILHDMDEVDKEISYLQQWFWLPS